MHVGIIGQGVIGKAQARMFRDHEVVTYDPATDPSYPYDALAACDFAVICVGTPAMADGSANIDYVEQAFHSLPPALPVLLRSTVPPGTTQGLGGGLICHLPEFMGENPAHPWQESTDVPYLILGGSPVSREFFAPRLAQVHPGVIYQCSSVESELVKYTANLYWAGRVTFVNEMANICETFGADWETVREGWLQDPRMTPAYTSMGGHPAGFGGRCWPKDLNALINASVDANYVPEFLAAIRSANERFTDA